MAQLLIPSSFPSEWHQICGWSGVLDDDSDRMPPREGIASTVVAPRLLTLPAAAAEERRPGPTHVGKGSSAQALSDELGSTREEAATRRKPHSPSTTTTAPAITTTVRVCRADRHAEFADSTASFQRA